MNSEALGYNDPESATIATAPAKYIAVLDFFKAFDTVLYDGLLSKLKHYVIDDKIWTWISNFRKQRVVVDGIQSDLFTVTNGQVIVRTATHSI